VHYPACAPRGRRVSPPPGPPFRARIAPQPLDLDPDRAPPVLELVVLGDLLNRNVRVVPHAAHVLQPGAEILDALLRPVGGEPLLKLPEGPLHEALGLFRRVDPDEVERHVVAWQELRLDDER